jgi:undecaprenyl-diphosphatase
MVLSVFAAGNDTLPGDRTISEWLQGRPLPGQDLSDAVRAITGTEVVLATGAAVCLILWLRGYQLQAILLAFGLVALAALQFGIKEAVDRPRPTAEMVEVRASASSPSFPSGHVMGAAFLYGYLIYLSLTLSLPRFVRWALVGGAAAVVVLGAPVNVWLGVHWPSDVVGAYLWACALILLLILFDRSRIARTFTSGC